MSPVGAFQSPESVTSPVRFVRPEPPELMKTSLIASPQRSSAHDRFLCECESERPQRPSPPGLEHERDRCEWSPATRLSLTRQLRCVDEGPGSPLSPLSPLSPNQSHTLACASASALRQQTAHAPQQQQQRSPMFRSLYCECNGYTNPTAIVITAAEPTSSTQNQQVDSYVKPQVTDRFCSTSATNQIISDYSGLQLSEDTVIEQQV